MLWQPLAIMIKTQRRQFKIAGWPLFVKLHEKFSLSWNAFLFRNACSSSPYPYLFSASPPWQELSLWSGTIFNLEYKVIRDCSVLYRDCSLLYFALYLGQETCAALLTLKLPWVTKREFLLTISIQYHVDKRWELIPISIRGIISWSNTKFSKLTS